jgi:hypothetical protein
MADFVIHEGVLQVDNDQGRSFRIKVGKNVLRPTPSDDAFYDGRRKRDAIHCGFSWMWGLRIAHKISNTTLRASATA